MCAPHKKKQCEFDSNHVERLIARLLPKDEISFGERTRERVVESSDSTESCHVQRSTHMAI